MAYFLKDAAGAEVKHNGNPVMVTDRDVSVKGVDVKDRTVVIVGTDETRDRDGDIIKMDGWDIRNYLKNPVFLWSHTYSGPGSVPLGKATKVIKRSNPARMEFTIQFPSKGVNPFADMIFDLYSEGIIKASSVGFIAQDWEDVDKTGESWGKMIKKQELLELSGCAVPCNPSALVASVKGFLTDPTDENVESVMSLLKGTKELNAQEIGVDEEELDTEMKSIECVFIDESGDVTGKEIESNPEPIDNTDKSSYLDNEDKEATSMPQTQEENKSEALRTAVIPEGLEAGQLFRLACDPESGECSLEPIDVNDLVPASDGGEEKGMVVGVGHKKALEDAMAILADVLKAIETPEEAAVPEIPAEEQKAEENIFYDDAGLEKVADAIANLTHQIKGIMEA